MYLRLVAREAPLGAGRVRDREVLAAVGVHDLAVRRDVGGEEFFH